jgi:plasmid stabilization system protein ParE
MNVVWLATADQDRAAIIDHIAADNPAAAIRIDELFSDAAARLKTFPMLLLLIGRCSARSVS